MHLYCMLIRIHHLHVVHVIYIHNGNLEEGLTNYMHRTAVVAFYYIHLPSIYNIYNIQTLSFLTICSTFGIRLYSQGPYSLTQAHKRQPVRGIQTVSSLKVIARILKSICVVLQCILILL